nr:glycosyl hydrolase [Micromonospora sp. DSM 115978]
MIPEDVDEFCRRRGSPCDVSLVYVGRNDWPAVTRPTYLFDTFRNWPGRLAIAVPPYPERSGNSLPVCASGAYDAHWRAFGQTLNDYGRQNSIIHLAWEANGNWFEWSATNPTAYVNCWRRIADAINSTANPDPTLAWIINAHYSQNPPSHNPLDIYPGDAWVDVVGLDAYDHYPASRTRAEFNQQANTMGGINWLYNFARARGKMFAVGEWGVVSGSNGGGDNPNYIDWMYEWFVDHQEFLLFENYFTNCDPGNVGSNLFRPFSGGGT